MAANSCFNELLLIAFFGHLHQCFRVGHPIMIAWLYLLMKLVHLTHHFNLGEVYFVQTCLINLIKCGRVLHMC